jgi:hypothetical protein
MVETASDHALSVSARISGAINRLPRKSVVNLERILGAALEVRYLTVSSHQINLRRVALQVWRTHCGVRNQPVAEVRIFPLWALLTLEMPRQQVITESAQVELFNVVRSPLALNQRGQVGPRGVTGFRVGHADSDMAARLIYDLAAEGSVASGERPQIIMPRGGN